MAHQTGAGRAVLLARVVARNANEVRLSCYSPERAEKKRGIVERFGRRSERALEELDARAVGGTHAQAPPVPERRPP